MIEEARAGNNIMIVDDSPQNLRLLNTLLKRGGFVTRPVKSGRQAIQAAVADPPDLVLLDIQMPEISGLDVCRWFKQNEQLQDIPILFLSGLSDIQDKLEAFRAGGVDYISKPFQEQEVLVRVRTHLRLRQLQAELTHYNQQLEQKVAQQVKTLTASQMATIFALAKLAENRDEDTGQHVERVQAFSRTLAEQMREMGFHAMTLNDSFIDNLYQTACLHDLGKVSIPDAILLKPGKLNPDEFAIMKTHSLVGAKTLSAVLKRYPDNQFLGMGVKVARSHHEKWDGSGYPDGLIGPAIPLCARLVALSDFYDALTSKRCYRPAFSPEALPDMIQKRNGTHFDPDVVAAFEVIEDRFRHIQKVMQEGG